MTTQLYLQKAEMQLSRGLEEKALESLLSALALSKQRYRQRNSNALPFGEYQFVHQQYVQAQEQFSWISDRAEQLEHDYDDLLNEEIREAEVLLGIMQRFGIMLLSDEEGGIVPKVLRDGLVFKDEDGQVIFNQYSFCELVKHLLVELVGISYEEASQIVERSPLAAPVDNAMDVAIFSHDLPYYWAMFSYYGNGYWWGDKGNSSAARRIWMPISL